MKNLLLALCAFLVLAGCNQDVAPADFYGEKVTKKGAISADELLEKMEGKETMEATLVGNVEAVCQVKGCWLILETGDGEGMRVTFKDYGFFVPKDLTGKVVMNGVAEVQVTSVEDLRHYAEDEGQSPEDIEAITQPVREIAFVATGVMPVSK